MSTRTTAIQISASCDGYHCWREETATGTTLADARLQLRSRGWTIVPKPYERTFCAECQAERRQLVRDGVLGADGSTVLDLAGYDRWLDGR